jgi:hypothetical protein
VVLEGKSNDPRSDFYALGVIWFEMLTGQKPFTAKTAFALAMRHAHEEAPRPSSLVPFQPVPQPVEALLLQLMAKSADARPPSAGALIELLAGVEQAAAVAELGAPLDATVTDVSPTPNSTAVVPLRLTPSSARPATTPSAGAPAVAHTPATGLVTPGAELSAAELMRVKFSPRLRAAVGGLLALAVFGALSALWTIKQRVVDEDVVLDAGPPTLSAPVGAAQPARPPPSFPTSIDTKLDGADAGPAAAARADGRAEREDRRAERDDRRAERREARAVRKDDRRPDPAAPPPPPPPTAPPPPPAPTPAQDGFLRVVTTPASALSVDDGPLVDAPRDLTLSSGRHRLRLSIGGDPVAVDVRPGDCRVVRLTFGDNGVRVVDEDPRFLTCSRR